MFRRRAMTLLAVFFMLSLVGKSQERMPAKDFVLLQQVKIGLLQTEFPSRYLLLGFERAFDPRITIQPEFGYSWIYPLENDEFRYNGFHFGIKPRYYFALRRQRSMSGFYTGLSLSHRRQHFRSKVHYRQTMRVFQSQASLIAGYQHAIHHRIRIDLGASMGHSFWSGVNVYDPDGNYVKALGYSESWIVTAFLQAGFAF